MTRKKLASGCCVAARNCITKTSWCHPPTYQILCSPGKITTHDWSLSHMKRHVQQAEQQLSVSKLTKYCTCLDPGPRCKWRFIWDHDRGRRSIWWVWTMTHGAPRRVNHSSSATRKSHASFFRARRSIWWCWRMTPVAHRIVNVYSSTTKYFSSTVPYYSVLQGITKYYSTVLLCTRKCYKVLLRTQKSYMKCHWHCDGQQLSPSNITKYCACHEKSLSWFIDPCHTWNVRWRTAIAPPLCEVII